MFYHYGSHGIHLTGSVKFQHSQESFLRHLYVANLLHSLLSLLLFLEQLTLSAHIATIALGQHVLAHLLHRLASHNLGTYGSLDGNVKLLSGKQFLEFLAHATTEIHGIIHMGKRA